MRFNKKELKIIFYSLLKRLNQLKREYEKTQDTYLVEEIKKTKELLDKVIEGL